MRVLVVLASTNQMASGTGRVVVELLERLRDRFDFEIAIDDHVARNRDLAQRAGERLGVAVHVLRASPPRRGPDPEPVELPALLACGAYDVIECVSWANAATNDAVLTHAPDATLVFTPHHQPLRTVAMSIAQAEFVAATEHALLRRAGLVCCDTAWERDVLLALEPRAACCVLALGCGPRPFGGPVRAPRLVWVGDLAEPRKRFDRVLDVFAAVRAMRPEFRLAVAGPGSERAAALIPEELQESCDVLGFVDETALGKLYAGSAGLLLCSEDEAFGLTALEALACGTPAYMTDIPPLRSAYAGFRGAVFAAPDDAHGTALRLLGRNEAFDLPAARGDRAAVVARHDWDRVAARKGDLLAAAAGPRDV